MTVDRSADLATIAQFVKAVETSQWQRDAEAFLGFHDTVLGSGAVSLPVLRDLVTDWIAGAR